jgi:hypothetical protein
LDRLVQKGDVHDYIFDDRRGTHVYTAAISRKDVRDYPEQLARLVRVLRLTAPELTHWCYTRGQLSQHDKTALLTTLHDLPHEALPLTSPVAS